MKTYFSHFYSSVLLSTIDAAANRKHTELFAEVQSYRNVLNFMNAYHLCFLHHFSLNIYKPLEPSNYNINHFCQHLPALPIRTRKERNNVVCLCIWCKIIVLLPWLYLHYKYCSFGVKSIFPSIRKYQFNTGNLLFPS